MGASILLITLFYGICIYGLYCDGLQLEISQLIKKIKLCEKLVLFILGLAFLIFAVYWIKQNRFIYYWDYSGYWTISIDRMNYIKNNSFIDIMKTLYQSINNDDYNVFLPTIIAFPLNVFGYTFSRYVVICGVMFLLPAFFIQGLIIQKLIQGNEIRRERLYIVSIIVAMCLANNYYAVFRGYIDVAYLVPMSTVIYLLVDYDFNKKNILKNIAISLLLIMIWICRRYTIFFIIGFIIAMLVKVGENLIQARNRKVWKNVIYNFLEIGFVSLIVLCICFRKFFLHALLTDYGKMYSAYDATLLMKINTLIRSFGYITAIMVILVGIICFITKNQIANYVMLLSLMITETITFWRTQDMSIQHTMLLNIPVYIILMLPFVSYTAVDIMENDGQQKVKRNISRIGMVLCATSMILNFTKVFSTFMSAKGCGNVFSERYYPFQRDDIDKLDYLAERLNSLTEGTDDWVYVAASGNILNADILRKLYMPYSKNAVNQMYNTSDVDLRDGFPTYYLWARYVVTTDPVQTHLETGQEVVTYLANATMDSNSYIGCHFEELDQVDLDDGVIAKIYVKTSAFTDEDLQKMKEYYMNLYPEDEELFGDRIVQ